jgi:NADPH-dependent ferric siderophore reductase
MPEPRHPSSLDLAERLKVNARSCSVSARRIMSPSLVEITLRGDAELLAGVAGNDVMVLIDPTTNPPLRRRYSVRDVDALGDTLSLWVSTTHDGPAARWAREANVGDEIDLVGPRGKIPLDESADWHLFVGDVSSLGAFYRMGQSIETPGRAIFIVELDHPDDALTATFAEDLGVTAIFVDRDGRAHDDPSGLLSGLAAFTLPPDEGHAYLFGEFHVMRAVKTALMDRGLSAAQISLKAFYRIGQSNGPNGEPDKEP